jgi:uncharacterized protein YjbI with pentapeptide repeats
MVDRPPQSADDDNAKAQQRRRLAWKWVGAGLAALGLLVVFLACVLWIPRWLYPSLTDSDLKGVRTAQGEPDAAKVQELKGGRLKLQNDARTTLLQGLGAVLVLLGAGIGARVTLRQIRVNRDQLQTTREQMAHTLETTQQQLNLTEQGQVTDRYTRAVEQLGHEKAPVRLGALYSLEHLAQDNPKYRQTVVDVVCAYLRMPYTLPAQTELDAEQVEEMAPPANGRDRAPYPASERDPAREELQVRQTAQRLLANHLRRPPETSGQEAQLLPPSPQQAFWPGISLDLTGATLVDFNFAQVSVIQGQFAEATFHGDARFGKATFQGDARFDEATFQGDAQFGKVTFQRDASFAGATFQRDPWFGGATFQGDAWFGKATFQGGAWFTEMTFQGGAWFDGATFQGGAKFGKVTFQRDASFAGATFQDRAWFDELTFPRAAEFSKVIFQRDASFAGATFQGGAWFGKATFQRDASFGKATFQRDARFDGVTFQGAARFDGAHVLHFETPDKARVWPDGWIVRSDPTDPSRGMLWPAEDAEEPEPAFPPSDPTGNGSGTG